MSDELSRFDIDAFSTLGFLEELAARGMPSGDLRERLEWSRADDPHDGARVALDLHLSVALECIDRTGEPVLHAIVAHRRAAARYGLLGFVCMTQPDLERALRVLARFVPFWITGVGLAVTPTDGALVLEPRLEPRCCDPTSRAGQVLVESILVAVLAAGQTLTRSRWAPRVVRVSRPMAPGHHQRMFGDVPVEVHPSPALLIGPEALSLPLELGQPDIAAFFETHLGQVLEQRSQRYAVSDRLRAFMAARLPVGDWSLRHAARSLAMSDRTLQRHLAEEGTTFMDVLTETRRALAFRYLSSPDLPVHEVAFLLGYEEVSSFQRAFRRWTGTSPSEHRRRLR